MKCKKRSLFVILLIVLLLIADQVVKVYVKTHMTLDESIPVFGQWFYIRFLENPGAAYGMELGGEYGKLILSVFRIVAVTAIGWYIHLLAKREAPVGVVLGFAIVFAGALGNIIDSTFYGVIFSDSTPWEVANFVPWGTGYASLLHGSVVDMLYFPIIEIEQMPDWIPLFGGEPYTFFSPIFNLADSYVSCGVIYMILFHRKYFK